MFCSQCGTQAEANSSFCTKCGNRFDHFSNQAQTPEQPLQAPSGDTVEWVFNAQRKLSLFKIVPCYIVFMKNKLVLAHLSPEFRKAESAKASREIKSKELGFFKGSAYMMRFWAEYYKKYYSMTADAILAEDPANIALYYQNITKVLFKCFSENLNFDGDGSSSVTQGKLNFLLAGGETIKFTHSQQSDRSVKERFTRLFGNKLKFIR